MKRQSPNVKRTWTWNYVLSVCLNICCWSVSRAISIVCENACFCDAVCSAISTWNATGPSSRNGSFLLEFSSIRRSAASCCLGESSLDISLQMKLRRDKASTCLHPETSYLLYELTAIFKLFSIWRTVAFRNEDVRSTKSSLLIGQSVLLYTISEFTNTTHTCLNLVEQRSCKHALWIT